MHAHVATPIICGCTSNLGDSTGRRRPRSHNRAVGTQRHLNSAQVTRLRAVEVVAQLVPVCAVVPEHAHVACVWIADCVVKLGPHCERQAVGAQRQVPPTLIARRLARDVPSRHGAIPRRGEVQRQRRWR